jgi:hypothetical protein
VNAAFLEDTNDAFVSWLIDASVIRVENDLVHLRL